VAHHWGIQPLELRIASRQLLYEEYHPYGTSAYQAMRSGVEASAKRYRYGGKERDEETGLYYHGARYYAPWLGRWTAADPSGMVDGPGLYNYVRGSPVGLSDPSGRETCLDTPTGTQCFREATPVSNAGTPEGLSAYETNEGLVFGRESAPSEEAPCGSGVEVAAPSGPVGPQSEGHAGTSARGHATSTGAQVRGELIAGVENLLLPPGTRLAIDAGYWFWSEGLPQAFHNFGAAVTDIGKAIGLSESELHGYPDVVALTGPQMAISEAVEVGIPLLRAQAGQTLSKAAAAWKALGIEFGVGGPLMVLRPGGGAVPAAKGVGNFGA
jgi:RHS repeat-associated protein